MYEMMTIWSNWGMREGKMAYFCNPCEVPPFFGHWEC